MHRFPTACCGLLLMLASTASLGAEEIPPGDHDARIVWFDNHPEQREHWFENHPAAREEWFDAHHERHCILGLVREPPGGARERYFRDHPEQRDEYFDAHHERRWEWFEDHPEGRERFFQNHPGQRDEYRDWRARHPNR